MRKGTSEQTCRSWGWALRTLEVDRDAGSDTFLLGGTSVAGRAEANRTLSKLLTTRGPSCEDRDLSCWTSADDAIACSRGAGATLSFIFICLPCRVGSRCCKSSALLAGSSERFRRRSDRGDIERSRMLEMHVVAKKAGVRRGRAQCRLHRRGLVLDGIYGRRMLSKMRATLGCRWPSIGCPCMGKLLTSARWRSSWNTCRWRMSAVGRGHSTCREDITFFSGRGGGPGWTPLFVFEASTGRMGEHG